MAKREQREREANAQRQADRERAEKGARLAERRDQIRATLEEQQQQQASASSSSSQGEMVRIRVQFPNGTRIDRQFAATDSLEVVCCFFGGLRLIQWMINDIKTSKI
jgi:hypothetical protein